ncbi:isoleucine--tRNA ligase [Candidatus Microgenomates bacterium]|nr:MAG: isoleucine--tRNA ligase [Candidatus Microgenomates bacterium]
MAKKHEFTSVDPKVNFSAVEEKILKFWKENKIFEKSVEMRPADKPWTFLDGPPFVTGMPHYGSLLSSLPKDVFGRYWTMKGYRVRRVWGWDGHGLPIENKVENALDIKRKRDIEEVVGVDKFIAECKKYVNDVSAEWEWYVDHIGRWVDFTNAYKTWDFEYMESVMWVFKQLYDKGYVYKGLRVSLYCPHCATPISNFEVAMDAENYKDVTESATTYKYKVRKSTLVNTTVGKQNTKNSNSDTYLLAWSTTPWNKIVTPALAVNPKLTYVKVRQDNEFYILAKSTLKMLRQDESYEIVDTFKGSELVGKEFELHYDYYEVEKGKRAGVVIGGDFVTADEGTGIVTLAVYGEEDLEVMQRENIQLVFHVDQEGMLKDHVPKFGGMYYLKANKAVNEDLAKRNLIYRNDQYTHSVAHCWRCATRLFFNPQNAWYVNVQDLKSRMKKTNEAVNWFPKHFKTGRFLKSMEHAPDWNISRNRYWGLPVPVWECKDCNERFVPGSVAELEEASGVKLTDLHKPGIDKVIVKCKKCGKDAHRTPEVLDSWIEAGSASFAERHFPFSNQKLEDFFPPDFIAEYTGQIRAWFYVLHVIGTALYDSPAFKNVLVEGVILGTDGRKMSKNFKNYPDPKEMLTKYGGDALRLYLLGSPVMRGEDIRISEVEYRDQVRGLLLILWNVYNFFVTYAVIDKWQPQESDKFAPKQVLDQWILSRLHHTVAEVTEGFEKYNTPKVVEAAWEFINRDVSTWYVRRIRDRVGPAAADSADKQDAHQTLYTVLTSYCILLAPLIPFTTEEIYKNLTGEESVHLASWLSPSEKIKMHNPKLEQEMETARKIVTLGHASRKQNAIKVRTPLPKLTYVTPQKLDSTIEQLIIAEVNVKQVEHKSSSEKSTEPVVTLNLTITPELQQEGDVRELIRAIQQMRKEEGCKLDEKISLTLPESMQNLPQALQSEIRIKTLSSTITWGDELSISTG